eukprot:2495293-Rhodomonas_salina.1
MWCYAGCYAMCTTDGAYGATLRTKHCAVLRQRMVLPGDRHQAVADRAMGTPILLPPSMSGTDTARSSTGLLALLRNVRY